jgi:hypothetical protein
MRGDRADLQRAGSRKDLPDLIAVSMFPGVSGTHARLSKGTEVLVAFVDGDRAQPVITNFSPDSIPDELTLGGPAGASPIARVGDTVTAFFPPDLPWVGTISGSPASGFMSITTPCIGMIESGSLKAKA